MKVGVRVKLRVRKGVKVGEMVRARVWIGLHFLLPPCSHGGGQVFLSPPLMAGLFTAAMHDSYWLAAGTIMFVNILPRGRKVT